ncbi:uncharacterized protein [Drosophila pseudoobscura]|uniref:Myb/SANT-like DNA-binding domain-containing protein n=1 Tax=Drosophila pseudoobscura pseudoobscura TaxID=46245 RepID=A0A6I8V524_DROPS|nr:uncharacterized protein LOC6898856 [Drosophila pseudoobscura]
MSKHSVPFEQKDEDDNEPEQKYARLLSPAGSLDLHNGKWSLGEVEHFLSIINQLKLQKPLGRKRNAEVFILISKELEKQLGSAKTPDQLRIKYMALRRQYFQAMLSGKQCQHFEALHELLQGCGDKYPETDSNLSSYGEEIVTDGDDALDASSSMPSNVRCKWVDGEVDVFLELITSMGLQAALLRKRNAKVFKLLSKEMAKRQYNKGPDKLRIKFQLLRRLYNKTKNGGDTFEYFEAMRKLLDPTEEELAAVDAKPILSSGSDSESNDSDDEDGDISQRGGAHFWTDEEVDAFLLIIKENGFFRALDGSKKRNFKTLVHISNILAKQSFKRTPHQLRNKLRLLIKRYREAKKDGLNHVRILPRHFQLFDELINAPKGLGRRSAQKPARSAPAPTAADPEFLSDSDSESSTSSCDLLRAAGESDDYEDAFEIAPEPTPLEVLTSMNEGQKKLVEYLKQSNDAFLRQQRDMQKVFLQDVTELMRKEREETIRRISELLGPKHPI